MNPFERAPVASKAPEQEKPKNRLAELCNESSVLVTRRIETIPKGLSEDKREGLAKKAHYYFDILLQLRQDCHKEWVELNVPKDQEQLTDAQVEEMQKYTDSVEKKKLFDTLDKWRADWEDVAAMEKDEKEKQDLYLQIDALDELQGDMANWK